MFIEEVQRYTVGFPNLAMYTPTAGCAKGPGGMLNALEFSRNMRLERWGD